MFEGSLHEAHRRVHVIVNPRAGRGRAAEVWRRAEAAFVDAGWAVELHTTQRPGDGQQLARELDIGEESALLAVGGDGSFHELVEGLLGRADPPRVALGLLPGGSGNALAHDVDLLDPVRAARRLAAGGSRDLDVIRLETPRGRRHAFNVVGWGLAADVARRAERWRRLGARRYDLASAWMAVAGARRRARLQLDDERLEGEFAMVFVANTETTGAGMVLLPGARLDDGWLDVLVLRRTGRLELLRLLGRVRSGGHLEHPAVLRRRVRRFAIEGEPGDLNVDGDLLPGGAPVTGEVLPGAVRLMS